jgi:hypothetical protein
MLEVQKIIKNNPFNWEYHLEKPPYNLRVGRNDGYVILKYNQIESDFSEPVVRESRGIILDEENDYEVVCKAFDKFFNYGEELAANIDWKTAKIQEKVDGCLSKEVKISTDKGLVEIKKLCEEKEDYKVLSLNHETNELEFTEIEDFSVKENDNKEWFEIEIENGRKIKITGNHKVWLKNLQCYRRVDNLKEGDEILFVE